MLRLRRINKPLARRLVATGREAPTSRGSTRLRRPAKRARALDAALTDGRRTGSPVTHGWCAFVRLTTRAFSHWTQALCGQVATVRVPLDAFCIGRAV